MTDKEKIAKIERIINKAMDDMVKDQSSDIVGYIADAFIANGIGFITAEKARADRAENKLQKLIDFIENESENKSRFYACIVNNSHIEGISASIHEYGAYRTLYTEEMLIEIKKILRADKEGE